MSMDDVKNIPNELAKRIPEGSRILMQWHGGEPTLMGADFIEKSILEIQSDKRFKWAHGIQTNLTTYDDGWQFESLFHYYFINFF
jgi:sulfatase maturation enzyme AslB (radical SAM superfamily)